MTNRLAIHQGDVLSVLRTVPEDFVHCVVTSPPYWGLRDYGVAGQLGLERTPDEYVSKMVEVFGEVRRVLRDDGTLWLNLGDSYNCYAGNRGESIGKANRKHHEIMPAIPPRNGLSTTTLKNKDVVGIPWRVAFALQADGWYLRSDIIWCLSGGTWIYVWTEDSSECLMTVKDLYRIKGRRVMLWTGSAWTSLLGMSESKRLGNEIEIVLRSGERISCTPTHKFPTVHGLLQASEIRKGDILQRCRLPEPYPRKDGVIDCDAAWLCGLYIAEGSRSGDTIQISGHSKEESRWQKVKLIAEKFGGTATRTVVGNSMSIRLYGRVLNAIVDSFVAGRTAHDKGFSPSVWRMSNSFIEAALDGYLAGDGHWEEKNERWRLGFCRNYNLERDLRTACARLGWHLVLKISSVLYHGQKRPTFRGELRKGRGGHWNEKDTAEVLEIRSARCRQVYDLGVCGEPHLFSLASGILTHNSKPNPMPESVTDRPTKSHEYIFLLSKSPSYFYDAEAIKEPVSGGAHARGPNGTAVLHPKSSAEGVGIKANNSFLSAMAKLPDEAGRNKRSVWTIPSAPYREAHFATFPPDLVKPCILAGTSARGCCPKCGAGWERIVENGEPLHEWRKACGADSSGEYHGQNTKDYQKHRAQPASTVKERILRGMVEKKTIGWQPGCECSGNWSDQSETDPIDGTFRRWRQYDGGAAAPVPATVLDPFAGSGTVGQVALELGRGAVLIELNPEYVKLIEQRCHVTPGLPL